MAWTPNALPIPNQPQTQPQKPTVAPPAQPAAFDPLQAERNIRATYAGVPELTAAINAIGTGTGEQDPQVQAIMRRLLPEYQKSEDQSTAPQKILDQYNQLFGQYTDQAVNRLNRQTAPQRSRLVSEEAAMGRLDSPASRYSLNRFDEGANNNLTDLLGQLAGQQAGGTIDYTKFAQNLGLARDKENDDRNQFAQMLQFQKDLGAQKKRQFEDANSTDWLDTLNKGSTTFGNLFDTYGKFKNSGVTGDIYSPSSGSTKASGLASLFA